MLAGCLASVTDGNIANILILHHQKKRLTPTQRGTPKVTLCQHCNTTADNKELRTSGIERVLRGERGAYYKSTTCWLFVQVWREKEREEEELYREGAKASANGGVICVS